jgi:hypothetical protein
MAFIRNFLIAVALIGAPLGGVSADVPTKLDELDPAANPMSDADAEKALRQLRDLMLPAGERDENWNVGGADIEKTIRDLGADKYYVLQVSAVDGSTAVTILTDRPITDFASGEWRAVESYGTADAAIENPTLTFTYLSPRYVLGGRANNRRVRSAICGEGISHAILYELPGAPVSPEDKELPEFVRAMMRAIEGQTLCSRHDGDPSKGYSVRNYFPDGRLILNPDRSVSVDRSTIVPAAPVSTLIKPPPPAPATPQP